MTSLVFLTLLGKPMPERLAAFKKNPAAYEKLAQTAFDSNQALNVRWRALTTMGPLDPVFFRKHLERALTGKEWFLRNAALIAVLKSPREMAVKWSAALLKDPSLMVRTQAVRNLVGLEAKETERELWNQLWDKRNFRKNESLWIRAHIAEALARLADSRHIKPFQKMILDPDERLHKWGILGLEKATGIKLGSAREPVEVQRQKWLARLGVETI